MVEAHERGHDWSKRPGPPFAAGDTVLCDMVDEDIACQLAYVVQANHPVYLLRLEDGRTIDTCDVNVILFPCYSSSCFAPDEEDPFVDVKLESQVARGSFGIQVDAQRDSLRRIREEKENAKAVKSDDASIPVYLWNRRIPCHKTEEDRDRALAGFRKFGLVLFMKALRHDSASFLVETHGPDWQTLPRIKDGKATQLGRDQHAITNMIWHTTHVNWFEYQAGSRLFHL